MSEYHEEYDLLDSATRNHHRAIKSCMEELEAVDWYNQRVAVCDDEELKKVLAHNRDEEIEHACMTLEWLRRNMPKWDEHLRTYLFRTESIVEIEEHETSNGNAEPLHKPAADAPPRPRSGLVIGSLKRT